MALNAGIYGGGGAPVQIESPQNALAKLLTVQNAQQQNQLGAMKMDEYKQGVERSNGLRSLLSQSYDNPASREEALLRGGFTDESLKLGKDRRENSKADADTEYKKLEATHKRVEMIGQGLGYLKDNPTPENVQATLRSFVQSGLMPMEVAQQKLAELQADPTPDGIRKRAMMGYQAALSAKDQLPKFETRNIGGTTDTLAINPVTGKVNVANSVANTQSPDSLASNARMAADAAAGRSVTMRGQNMADGRARESAGIALSKPFEITGEDGKPVLVQQDKQGNIKPVAGYGPKTGAAGAGTEGERNAAGYASRMSAAEKIIEDQATKNPTSQKPGFIEQVSGGNGMIANASRSQPRQQYRQAQEDWVRAKLRKESGASIATDEMAREITVYFPQIGDGPDVIKQKGDARKVAEQAMISAGGRAVKPTAAAPASNNIDSLLDKYK